MQTTGALLTIPALLLGATPASAVADCSALAKTGLPNTTIATAESVPAGTFNAPTGRPVPNLPAFCRVAGVIAPSRDSSIRFEVWLPASGWTGRFQGIGNGGFAGAIEYMALGMAVRRGYATAATDTGHQGQGTDATWALNHPEKIVDFGYRAIHETARNAKALIRAFYGEPPRRSYFSSCSNGGRQALMEAQRFPEDYDGVIAGAPANYWTHLLAMAAFDLKALLVEPGSYIPQAKLPAIQAAALAACDALDGVKDGVIEDPSRCRFDPGVLLCRGPESNACLTELQVAALRKLYAGPRTSKGVVVFPGYSPGGEAEMGGWGPWITGPAPEKSLMFAFGTQYYKNMVYSNPAWDYRAFDVDRDTKASDDRMASILNSNDPDLSRFRKRGGKLILYHGWSDAAIPAQNTVDYYRSVVKKLGAKETGTFVRLFMVPGMQHCGGGAGPNSFGQMSIAQGDPLHDIDTALESWVEQGTPPEQIIATKYKKGMDAASGVERTRPLCAFPRVAHWKGAGSTDDAASFACAAP